MLPRHNMNNNTPPQEPPAQGVSSESGQTLPSRFLQPTSDPSVSKRVCFYKSGDYKFSGHRMVITTRTFKTFDALLDALSKKVPLPFGVRTITTPRGTHFVKGLEDLSDGGSYVCSDQKRVKPLNLDEVNRRQVPWNATRLLSTGRQRRPGPAPGQYGRRNEGTKRPAKVNDRAVVRTPKRLTVIKNKDPTVQRTIVLQRRTAPTFEALLDYLSHILQFPVLKLYSTDGRRVDGLAALILCSGVVVAAGNEPFRLGSYSFHQSGQLYMETVESSMLQPPPYNNKSFSGGRGSKNFSQSSERYIVNQINASRNGSTNNNLLHNNGSFEAEMNQSLETCGISQADNDHCPCIVPQDNDIEKSFCVNQDGSMTVEMKVRLTIKEEEMLHWTTTLSRTSLSKRTVCPLVPELGNTSPDSNNAFAKNSSSISEDEAKEENHPAVTERDVGFNNEHLCQDYNSMPLEKTKPRFKRTPTPGPQHVKKKLSGDSVKMLTESAVQESTMGHYSYMARTADGGTAEGYCVVQHSSSKRPIPRPRKTASAGTNNKGSSFSMKSTGVAEVLQIETKGRGVRETVMHIYESQGCHDSYFANEQYSADGVPLHNSSPVPGSQPSTNSGSRLSSNDCDIDSAWQPPNAESLQRQKEEIFSLSSEPMSPAQTVTNDLSSGTVNETQAETDAHIQREEKVKDNATGEKKKVIKPAKKKKTPSLTSSSEKNQKETIKSPSKNSKKSSSDKTSSKASVGKKSFASSESAKSGPKNKAVEKPHMKKFRDEKTPSKEKALLANIENVKRTPSKNTSKAALKENGHNVNVPETKTGRSQMKKNISDFLQPKKSLLVGKKTVSKPKSMTENRTPSPKKSLEMNESVSMPLLNPSPSEIHQYVENWLEKVSPDAVPYTEETVLYNSEPQKKVVFQIGGESESDEKSEKQSNPEECCPSSYGAMKKSGSCLSAPLYHEEQVQSGLLCQQMLRGSCVSMPIFRVEAEHQENQLRSHKSAEAIGPAGDEPPSSERNNFTSKAKLKPVLGKICSSMECIRNVPDTNLEKSNSYPDFPTQVASVFGSSCKAFLSFVSVMTLRDSLTDAAEDGNSEAMLMMESLQKISVIENEEEQRASLTDLQNKASSQFRESWKDFQNLRERIESEAMSPKFSETEFALDVTSEGGDVFDENQLGIDELMEELNIPQDLREEITSTIQQVKSFFPMEESNSAKTANQSSEFDTTCEEKNINEIMSGSEKIQELVKEETVLDFKESEPGDESLRDKENEKEGKEVESQVDDGDKEDDNIEEVDDVAQERGKADQERCEESEEEVNQEENRDTEQDEVGSGNEEEDEPIEKVEEGTEEEMTVDGGEDHLKGELEVNEEDDRLTDKDQGGSEENSVEETDDREAVEGHTTEESEEEKDEKTMERNNESKGEEEEEMDESIKERDEEEEMEDSIKERDEEEENNDVISEKEEEEENDDVSEEEEEEEEEGTQNITEVIEEKDVDKETEGTNGERSEEEEAENVILDGDDEERLENITGESGEEEVEDINRDINEEEESKNIISSEEEQREDSIKEGDEETETEDDMQVRDEEEETENKTGEREQEGETEDDVEEKEEEEVEVEEEDVNEGSEREFEDEVEDEDGGEEEVKSTEEKMITGQEEEDDKKTDEEGESDEGGESKEEMETTAMSAEEESMVEEEQVDNHLSESQTLDEEEEEEEGDEDKAGSVELNDGSEYEVDSPTGDQVCKKLLLEEASYLHQRSGSCDEDQAHPRSEKADLNAESPSKYSSVGLSAKEEDNGTDSAKELQTDEGGEGEEERSSNLPHPVEVSQELLDFVNSALKSSSLIFTYDSQGNVRIEPDRSRTVQKKQKAVRKKRQDSSYSFKCLPSPNTSDLSDYRPESSGSGGYKTQDSLDIVTESGEESSERPFPVCRHSAQKNNNPDGRKTNVERVSSKKSSASQSKSAKSFSTGGSGTKASKEDLSYFSAASSLKQDSEPATEAAEKHPPDDGVLIDQGRWLLKENHLIRKSPPVSVGMYGQLENTSIDSASDESPSHSKPQHSPLAAISSSELEEMAKPQTPKCTYFNMPHGSDSDPFMDDASVLSGKNCTSNSKGRGVKVSPTIDTSKTWANKNGSLSSFASVEFKVPDRKVHPEGESSAVTQARRTSSARGGALQAQDSLETLHLRCGQYCPIL